MFSRELRQSLLLVWPLLAGLMLIMIGNGLQGTLLGLRASIENFPVYVTGIIMSLYYAGYLLGCYLTPRLISGVGHIRVFAALASVASTTVLIHGVYVDPWVWAVIRIFSGISFAGLFIVAESWLNNIATNKLRGRIFGSYVFVMQGGLMTGQFLLGLGSVQNIDMFVWVSILVSLSMVPLMLANKPAPGYVEPESLPIKKLIRTSPLSLASVFVSGFCGGSFLSFAAVYGNAIGMTPSQIAMLLVIYILGSGVLTLIYGGLSDRFSRRIVIVCVAFIGAASVLAMNFLPWLYVLSFIFGGCMTSLYSLGVAYMSDHLKPSQLISASTTMIFTNGMGSTLGPLSIGFAMAMLGNSAFFYTNFVMAAFLFMFGIYRVNVSEAPAEENKVDFVPLPTRTATTPLQIMEQE